MTWRAAVAAAIGVMLTLGGCSSEPPPMQRLIIAAGEAGDVSAALAEGLAEAARATWPVVPEVIETNGPTGNIQLLADGKADVAFVTVDAASAARDGEVLASGTLAVAALAGLYDNYLHLVVRADSDLRTLADLSGRRIAIGAEGSVSDVLVSRLFGVAQPAIAANFQRSRPVDGAEALRAGTVDAWAVIGGLPMPAVATLAADFPIRLIPLGAEVTAVQAQFGERYLARTVPPTMYGPSTETPTIGVRAVLVVRDDMPDATAFALTKLLFDAKSRLVAKHPEARRLDPRSAMDTGTVPLHAGAARYYHETKLFA
jgi:TRAP transporter TAXI family solute receptor